MTTKQSLLSLLATSLLGCVAEPAQVPDDQPAAEADLPSGLEPEEGAWVTNPVDTPDGRQTLTYQVVDGRALFGGDIDLGDAREIASRALLRAEIRTGGDYRWHGAVIPYVIDPSNPKAAVINDAITTFSQQTLFTFVPRTNQTDYVDFKYQPNGSVSSSQLGRVGGEQDILLASICDTACAMHEIGHAIGLWHEQQRHDRDTYIQVMYYNIVPGYKNQFDIAGTGGAQYAQGADLFGFDFKSIMLYDSFQMGLNFQPTMVKVSDGSTWTRNMSLSQEDIQAAALLATPYNAAPIDLQVDGNSKCVTAPSDLSAINTGAYVWDCAPGWPNEKWYRFAVPNTTQVRLISAYSGLCLAEQYAAGSYVSMQPCSNGNTNETFTTTTVQTYWQTYKGVAAGYCLDTPGATNASPIGATACTSAPSQMLYTFNY
jgi:hypothetical protein